MISANKTRHYIDDPLVNTKGSYGPSRFSGYNGHNHASVIPGRGTDTSEDLSEANSNSTTTSGRSGASPGDEESSSSNSFPHGSNSAYKKETHFIGVSAFDHRKPLNYKSQNTLQNHQTHSNGAESFQRIGMSEVDYIVKGLLADQSLKPLYTQMTDYLGTLSVQKLENLTNIHRRAVHAQTDGQDYIDIPTYPPDLSCDLKSNHNDTAASTRRNGQVNGKTLLPRMYEISYLPKSINGKSKHPVYDGTDPDELNRLLTKLAELNQQLALVKNKKSHQRISENGGSEVNDFALREETLQLNGLNSSNNNNNNNEIRLQSNTNLNHLGVHKSDSFKITLDNLKQIYKDKEEIYNMQNEKITHHQKFLRKLQCELSQLVGKLESTSKLLYQGQIDTLLPRHTTSLSANVNRQSQNWNKFSERYFEDIDGLNTPTSTNNNQPDDMTNYSKSIQSSRSSQLGAIYHDSNHTRVSSYVENLPPEALSYMKIPPTTPSPLLLKQYSQGHQKTNTFGYQKENLNYANSFTKTQRPNEIYPYEIGASNYNNISTINSCNYMDKNQTSNNTNKTLYPTTILGHKNSHPGLYQVTSNIKPSSSGINTSMLSIKTARLPIMRQSAIVPIDYGTYNTPDAMSYHHNNINKKSNYAIYEDVSKSTHSNNYCGPYSTSSVPGQTWMVPSPSAHDAILTETSFVSPPSFSTSSQFLSTAYSTIITTIVTASLITKLPKILVAPKSSAVSSNYNISKGYNKNSTPLTTVQNLESLKNLYDEVLFTNSPQKMVPPNDNQKFANSPLDIASFNHTQSNTYNNQQAMVTSAKSANVPVTPPNLHQNYQYNHKDANNNTTGANNLMVTLAEPVKCSTFSPSSCIINSNSLVMSTAPAAQHFANLTYSKVEKFHFNPYSLRSIRRRHSYAEPEHSIMPSSSPFPTNSILNPSPLLDDDHSNRGAKKIEEKDFIGFSTSQNGPPVDTTLLNVPTTRDNTSTFHWYYDKSDAEDLILTASQTRVEPKVSNVINGVNANSGVVIANSLSKGNAHAITNNVSNFGASGDHSRMIANPDIDLIVNCPLPAIKPSYDLAIDSSTELLEDEDISVEAQGPSNTIKTTKKAFIPAQELAQKTTNLLHFISSPPLTNNSSIQMSAITTPVTPNSSKETPKSPSYYTPSPGLQDSRRNNIISLISEYNKSNSASSFQSFGNNVIAESKLLSPTSLNIDNVEDLRLNKSYSSTFSPMSSVLIAFNSPQSQLSNSKSLDLINHNGSFVYKHESFKSNIGHEVSLDSNLRDTPNCNTENSFTSKNLDINLLNSVENSDTQYVVYDELRDQHCREIDVTSNLSERNCKELEVPIPIKENVKEDIHDEFECKNVNVFPPIPNGTVHNLNKASYSPHNIEKLFFESAAKANNPLSAATQQTTMSSTFVEGFPPISNSSSASSSITNGGSSGSSSSAGSSFDDGTLTIEKRQTWSTTMSQESPNTLPAHSSSGQSLTYIQPLANGHISNMNGDIQSSSKSNRILKSCFKPTIRNTTFSYSYYDIDLSTKWYNQKLPRSPLKRRVTFDPLALLLDAALEGEYNLVVESAKKTPNPSASNDEGITALHNSICAGHMDIVMFLVEFGCDINAPDSDGWTPLHCAASCNNFPMLTFLVERGASVFAETLSDRETPLQKCELNEYDFQHCAAYLYHVERNTGVINEGKVYALYDYTAEDADELNFSRGQELWILAKTLASIQQEQEQSNINVKNNGKEIPDQENNLTSLGKIDYAKMNGHVTSHDDTPPLDNLGIKDKLQTQNGNMTCAKLKNNETINGNEELEEEDDENDWWLARNADGQKGLVPKNYIGIYKRIEPCHKLQP